MISVFERICCPYGVEQFFGASLQAFNPGGGILPYMGYPGMCGPKGYGFSAGFYILALILVCFKK